MRVITGGNDVALAVRAPKERQELGDLLRDLGLKLELLKEHEDRARQHPDDPWYRGLRAMAKSAEISTSNSGKLILNPAGRGDGALVKLRKATAKLEVDLMPQEGLRGQYQRWTWSHDKEKYQSMLAEIRQWMIQVDSILHQDHLTLSLAIREVAVDTNTHVRSLENKIDKKAVISGLSPLEFRKRQLELFNNCIPIGQVFFEVSRG
ncbi:hypothetical protein OEA41_004642 [Lepraria neglecta]|uniref:Uncharacterized protein n=1 Tax=Lepraria neglecta TaxID=209136 RepID=A0AAD9YYA8_9LECA|nr:hypothetical protein OEA41_004642 [Lepraria neglecta]